MELAIHRLQGCTTCDHELKRGGRQSKRRLREIVKPPRGRAERSQCQECQHGETSNECAHDRDFDPPDASGETLDNQRAVGTAKSERVRNGDVDLHVSGRIRTVIKVASWVLIHNVDGWRRDLVMHR